MTPEDQIGEKRRPAGKKKKPNFATRSSYSVANYDAITGI